MKTHKFEVLSPEEIEQIHAASMDVLANVGVKVDYGVARQIFAKAGASVGKANHSVGIPEVPVMQAISRAPKIFRLDGAGRRRPGLFSTWHPHLQPGYGKVT
jgi:trimethylamine--corrinoid protein Co-methyltransferase